MPGELFVEKQSFRRDARWLFLIFLATASLPIAVLFFGKEELGSMSIPILISLLLVLAFAGSQMTVSVTPTAVTLVYAPVYRRTIPAADIESATAETYRPILEYGGWGLRYGPGRGWAYTVTGDRGVRLRLRSGKTILLGSKEPDRLADAVRQIIATADSSGTNT